MLVGIPMKEFCMYTPSGEECWVIEKLVEEHLSLGYKLCPDCMPRMSYAVPTWVPMDPEQETLLVLDDFNRCNPLFMQAIMALVQFGEYVSWKLPEKTHLLLTSNIDNGEYNVSSTDSAQQTRMLTFQMDFDYEQYGKWMDRCGLKTQAINFMLLHPEIFDQSSRVNARTYTMFANAIAGLKDLSNTDTLDYIALIAKGCFGDETTIGNLFIAFVHNNLDKLLSAEDMLGGKWEDTAKAIKDNVTKDGEYRADIASVLTMRLVNYIEILADKNPEGKKVDEVIARINEIVSHKETLLTEDLILNLIKKLNAKFQSKCTKLLLNPKVMTKILY